MWVWVVLGCCGLGRCGGVGGAWAFWCMCVSGWVVWCRARPSVRCQRPACVRHPRLSRAQSGASVQLVSGTERVKRTVRR
eukprot:12158053-Alexandrium_andersonii.AAC.1